MDRTHQTEVISVVIHPCKVKWTWITHIPGRHLAFPSAPELITAEMCRVGKTKCGFDMQTVTYCRLSSLLSLPSSVVSLFLPWGGDGRFLQGKSNNLSHHQTSLHVETVGCRIIQAIFLVIVRKIVHGRLVGVVMHYRSQVAHGTGEGLDVGWCSSFSSTSFLPQLFPWWLCCLLNAALILVWWIHFDSAITGWLCGGLQSADSAHVLLFASPVALRGLQLGAESVMTEARGPRSKHSMLCLGCNPFAYTFYAMEGFTAFPETLEINIFNFLNIHLNITNCRCHFSEFESQLIWACRI